MSAAEPDFAARRIMTSAKRTAKRESVKPTVAKQPVTFGLCEEFANQRHPRNTECPCIQFSDRGKVLPFQSPNGRLLRRR